MIADPFHKLAELTEEALITCKAELSMLPDGNLICWHDKNGRPHYYQAYCDLDGTYRRKGIGKKPAVLQAMARKGYLEAAQDILEGNLAAITRAQADYVPCDTEHINARLGKAFAGLPTDQLENTRVALVLLGIDEDMNRRLVQHEQWAREPYERSQKYPESLTLRASNGTMMRSKSELLIAERLARFQVPYRYEQVITVGGCEMAPDFTFQDRNGDEFYLEFCGMMDDPGYVEGFKSRRQIYESAGMCEWNRMIYLFATGNEIDLEEIDEVIQKKIMPRL